MLLPLLACGTTTDDDGQDATPVDTGMDAGQNDAGLRAAEIGTGVVGFEALTEGQDVALTPGPQGCGCMGGFHIWHAVKTRGLDPEDILMSFTVFSASNREELGGQERRANLQPDSSGGDVAYGVAPRFADCCLAADQDVIMRVVVTDSNGMTGEDERRVHATGCIDDGVDLCP